MYNMGSIKMAVSVFPLGLMIYYTLRVAAILNWISPIITNLDEGYVERLLSSLCPFSPVGLEEKILTYLANEDRDKVMTIDRMVLCTR